MKGNSGQERGKEAVAGETWSSLKEIKWQDKCYPKIWNPNTYSYWFLKTWKCLLLGIEYYTLYVHIDFIMCHIKGYKVEN